MRLRVSTLGPPHAGEVWVVDPHGGWPMEEEGGQHVGGRAARVRAHGRVAVHRRRVLVLALLAVVALARLRRLVVVVRLVLVLLGGASLRRPLRAPRSRTPARGARATAGRPALHGPRRHSSGRAAHVAAATTAGRYRADIKLWHVRGAWPVAGGGPAAGRGSGLCGWTPRPDGLAPAELLSVAGRHRRYRLSRPSFAT